MVESMVKVEVFVCVYTLITFILHYAANIYEILNIIQI